MIRSIRWWWQQIQIDRKDARRYRRLRSEMSTLYRYCGGLPLTQVEMALEWLMDNDDNHFRDLEETAEYRWPSDVMGFRHSLLAMSETSVERDT